MANIPIRLTCADYAKLAPLMIGDVQPAGVDLTLLHRTEGSWLGRVEMLQRATGDAGVDGGETSMAGHLRRIAGGDRSFVALPVFPLRNFTARDLYIRKDGSIHEPADLIGKRVGMYDWVASGTIWYRHFLNWIGVPPDKLEWWIGQVEGAWSARHPGDFPPGVNPVPEGRTLVEMLLAGDIDALYSPPRPTPYHPKDGPIVRLFPDPRPIEHDYYRATKCYPPQHLIVLRRAVWEANTWLAKAITDAFVENNRVFATCLRNFPYASPWLDSELEEAEAVMGADYQPDGYEAGSREVEIFCRQSHDAGITPRVVTAEEYFAEFLAS
jgi:4,5-dihydroxyphthalate decarboxylase